MRSKDNRLIAYKLSCQQRSKITAEEWVEHHTTLLKACIVQGNNPRGLRKAGSFLHCLLLGWRKDGDGRKVNEYVYQNANGKDGNKKPEVEEVEKGIAELMADLEKWGLIAVPAHDTSINNKMQEDGKMSQIFMNGKKGRFAAMAIATCYWSACHIDDDVFYTLLSCYCPSLTDCSSNNEILFYFLFPSVGKAIPMQNTDIPVFNSDFPHCASNYRHADSFIF